MSVSRSPDSIELESVTKMPYAYQLGMVWFAKSQYDYESLVNAITCFEDAYDIAVNQFKENLTPATSELLRICFDTLSRAHCTHYNYVATLAESAIATKQKLLEKANRIITLTQHHIGLVGRSEVSPKQQHALEELGEFLLRYEQISATIRSEVTAEAMIAAAEIKSSISALMQLTECDNENYRLGKRALLRAAQSARSTQYAEAISLLSLAYKTTQAKCDDNFSDELIQHTWVSFVVLTIAYSRYVEYLISTMQFQEALKQQNTLFELIEAYQEIAQSTLSHEFISSTVLPGLANFLALSLSKQNKLLALIKQDHKPKIVAGLDATHLHIFSQISNTSNHHNRVARCGFIAIGVPVESMHDFFVSQSDADLGRVADLISEQIFNQYHGYKTREARQQNVRLNAQAFGELEGYFNRYSEALLNQLRAELGSDDQVESRGLLQAFAEPIEQARKAYKEFLTQPSIVREFLLAEIALGDVGAYTLLAWAILAERTMVIWKKNTSDKLEPLKHMSYFSPTDPDEPLHIVHVAERHYERLVCHSRTRLDPQPEPRGDLAASASVLGRANFLAEARARQLECKEVFEMDHDKENGSPRPS